MARIFLCSHQPKVSLALKRFLETSGHYEVVIGEHITSFFENNRESAISLLIKLSESLEDDARMYGTFEDLPDIPILFLGDHSDETLVEEIKRSGIDHYLPVHAKPMLILEKVTDLLEGAQKVAR